MLLLREEDVRALLPMGKALELVERAFVLHGEGGAVNQARKRIGYPSGMLHYMGAASPALGVAGLKAYVSSPNGVRFAVLVFDSSSPALKAIIEADWLGRIRTGAASGYATRLMARKDSKVAGVIGTGGQAETQVQALAAALTFDVIRVYGRSFDRCEAFVERVSHTVQCPVEAVRSSQEAVIDSDVVTTITTSANPVFDGAWLRTGCHVNAAGSNQSHKREIDDRTVIRAGCIAVDDFEQAQQESGDLILAATDGSFDWADARVLGDIAVGKASGRQSQQEITLYESQGMAIQDLVVAEYVLSRAIDEGYGQNIRFGGTD